MGRRASLCPSPCGGYGAGGRGGGFPPQRAELVLNLRAHDGEAFGQVQVVEVGDLVALRLVLAPAGFIVGEDRRQVGAADGQRCRLRSGDACILGSVRLATGRARWAIGLLDGRLALAALAECVVIGTDEDLRFRVALVQGLGNGLQVAGVERDRHRVAGGLVQAGASGVALCDEDDPRRCADQVQVADLVEPCRPVFLVALEALDAIGVASA